MMTLTLMRRLDTWIGGPLAALMGLWPRRRRPAPSAPREIVIVKLMGLGSLLTCAGVWRVLRQRQPQARITVVSLTGTAAVARLLPEVDEVLSVSPQSFRSLVRDGWRVWRTLRRRRVDVLVDIEYFSNLCAIFCALCGARYRLGLLPARAGVRCQVGGGRAGPLDPPGTGQVVGGRAGPLDPPGTGQVVGGRAGPLDPPGTGQVVGGRAGPLDSPGWRGRDGDGFHHERHEEGAGRWEEADVSLPPWLDRGVVLREDRHFRDNVARLLAPLGVPATGLPVVTLTLPEEVRQEAGRLLAGGVAGWIVVNPHASELCRQRRWPLERFAQVVHALLTRDPSLGVVIPGTADERPYAEEFCVRLQPLNDARLRNLAGRTSLAVLAGVLQQSRLVLTGDTGVMHLAAAVGAPLVALFGPEAPVRYGPAGEPRRTVVLAGEVPCGPCLCSANRKQAPCTAEPAACMLSIAAADVQQACEWLLPAS